MGHEDARESSERLAQAHAVADALANRATLVHAQVAGLDELDERRELVVLVAVAHGRVVDGHGGQLRLELGHDVLVLDVLVRLELAEYALQVGEQREERVVVGKVRHVQVLVARVDQLLHPTVRYGEHVVLVDSRRHLLLLLLLLLILSNNNTQQFLIRKMRC